MAAGSGFGFDKGLQFFGERYLERTHETLLLSISTITQTSGNCQSVNRHALHVAVRQFEDHERAPGLALQSARIDHARLTGAMLFRDVRVAVEEKIECV